MYSDYIDWLSEVPLSDRQEGIQQIPIHWELDPIPLYLKMEATYFFEIQT